MSTDTGVNSERTSNAVGRTWISASWSRHSLAALALLQLFLHAWSACHDSFTWDEVAHLPSGLFHWERAQFGMFDVNPPLVRMTATLPLLAIDYESEWPVNVDMIDSPERVTGRRFLVLNGERSFWLLTVARWTCLPFSLLGMWVCWRWAGELFGDHSAVLVATMWCFSPNILGHGHLMTPDVASASLGIAAFYALRHWLLSPNWPKALVTGFAFGQAQAAKSSWIVLFGLWPLIWLLWRFGGNAERTRSFVQEMKQMATILFLGVWSINMWYGFEGTLTPLGEYQFLSRSLGGDVDESDLEVPGNRFKGTWLAQLPVPLPRHYVQGIDRQKHHFERPDMSYLRGEWRNRGWWYYYIYAAFVKEPLGYWTLGVLATVLGLTCSGYRVRWRDELLLLFPLIVFTLFISSQRGFNRHLRYLLPVFPFAFILVSRVARSVRRREWNLVAAMLAFTAWGVVSSLLVYPHSLGYFNEWAGGPKNGHRHLLSSNTDWGQDLLYLKAWAHSHPEATPLHVFIHMDRVDVHFAVTEPLQVPLEPTPGWHAVSVNGLHLRNGEFTYFLEVAPVATAGYSIFIYHLTDEDCRFIVSRMTTRHEPPIHELGGAP